MYVFTIYVAISFGWQIERSSQNPANNENFKLQQKNIV